MNQSLQSFTPLPKPMYYDSLGAREGCEPESGIKHYALEAFILLCVALHGVSKPVFNDSPLIGTQVGPTEATLIEPNHTILWTAWQATSGIRVGIVPYPTLPADNLGQLSGLFPSIKTTNVTLAFSRNGLLALAINKPIAGAFVQLKRYTNSGGSIQDVTFAGVSPLLFNTWNLNKGTGAQVGLVCLYLRPNFRSIFARFEQDSFATEVEVLPDMRVQMAVLLKIDTIDGKARIYGRDTDGRDILIYSDPYPQTITPDKSKNALLLASGSVQVAAVQVTIATVDKSTLGVTLDSGSVSFTTVDVPDDFLDASTSDTSLDSGAVTNV